MNKRAQQGMVNPQKNSNPQKEIPILIKILAVLYYIGAGFAVLGGVSLMFLSGSITLLIPALAGLSAFGIIIGIVVLGFAALYFFVGRGLWKAQNWARIAAIILSFLGVIGVIVSLLLGYVESAVNSSFGAVINAAIGFYMIFNKQVKQAFS